MRRMLACVCVAALFALLPGTASAERQANKSAFKGVALTVKPAEEPGKKKSAKVAKAFKADPAMRVIIEPAATVPGVDVVDGVQVPKDLNETGTESSGDEGDIPGDLVEAADDPFEGVNRVVFGFNQVVDRLVLEPSARIYRAVIPRPVRTGVTNVLNNLATPITLSNDILQGNPEAAANTIKRFMVNSTLGIGGIFDHATGLGEPLHREDFGQTLGTWGVGSGPYLVLPILGPSNPRDAGGMVVDTAVNPMTWILYDAPLWQKSIPVGTQIVVSREAILDDYENLRKNSPDLYASVRDLYAQKRQAEIANEAAGYNPGSGVNSLPPSALPQTLNPY
ncbi:MlaA family lipoprotein [Taklimakanibacter lacteus]|uniref:MlaA family lipoprotein n=1 Tax=Taklimakanibacter lacteus TaxID=2268456 RepID=UPI0013C449D5